MSEEREPRDKSLGLDLTVPVNTKKLMQEQQGCFGKLWDMREQACTKCADKDVCGIVFNDYKVKPTTKKLEEELGSKYLDLANFSDINWDDVADFVVSGQTTGQELIAKVMELANTSDTTSAVMHVKKFMQSKGYQSKEGAIWKI